jgi:hypothetical protein
MKERASHQVSKVQAAKDLGECAMRLVGLDVGDRKDRLVQQRKRDDCFRRRGKEMFFETRPLGPPMTMTHEA